MWVQIIRWSIEWNWCLIIPKSRWVNRSFDQSNKITQCNWSHKITNQINQSDRIKSNQSNHFNRSVQPPSPAAGQTHRTKRGDSILSGCVPLPFARELKQWISTFLDSNSTMTANRTGSSNFLILYSFFMFFCVVFVCIEDYYKKNSFIKYESYYKIEILTE